MASPSPTVIVAEAEAQVAEPQIVVESASEEAMEGVWGAIRRRLGTIYATWVEQQNVNSIWGTDADDA